MQGGLDRALRERSAREVVELDFPGYAIGGLSVGETREEMYACARATAALLPAEKPRYLMGVGTVRDLIAAIDCGIDLFDCVYPTRCGRNGRAMTRDGELNIFNAAFVRDFAARSALRLLDLHDVHARLSRASAFARRRCSGRACSRITTSTCSTRSMRDARDAIEAGEWAVSQRRVRV